jgi:hypothetical protein
MLFICTFAGDPKWVCPVPLPPANQCRVQVFLPTSRMRSAKTDEPRTRPLSEWLSAELSSFEHQEDLPNSLDDRHPKALVIAESTDIRRYITWCLKGLFSVTPLDRLEPRRHVAISWQPAVLILEADVSADHVGLRLLPACPVIHIVADTRFCLPGCLPLHKPFSRRALLRAIDDVLASSETSYCFRPPQDAPVL